MLDSLSNIVYDLVAEIVKYKCKDCPIKRLQCMEEKNCKTKYKDSKLYLEYAEIKDKKTNI